VLLGSDRPGEYWTLVVTGPQPGRMSARAGGGSISASTPRPRTRPLECSLELDRAVVNSCGSVLGSRLL
jgi:hypothetical protein